MMIRDKPSDEVPVKSPGPAEPPEGEPVTYPGQLPENYNPREYKNPVPDPSVKDGDTIDNRQKSR